MSQENLREQIYHNGNSESNENHENHENYESYETKSHMRNGAENAINIIANLILILGIIATVICAFTTIFIDVPRINYMKPGLGDTTKEFNPMGLIMTLIILFTTIMQWAFMKVVANISLNIKDINNKLK